MSSSLDRASPSPAIGADALICHSPDACYPRIFSPTPEFQFVHDDQQLPPGLHVRLNLETGRREARLNIPLDEAQGDGLPKALDVSTSAVILDETDDGEDEEKMDSLSVTETPERRPPPPYSNHGRILPPMDKEEAGLFKSSVALLLSGASSESEEQMAALEQLEELAHDIYYGVEIARNAPLVGSLIGLAGTAKEGATRVMSLLVLGNALQNNPSALDHIENSRPDLMADVMDLLDTIDKPEIQERLVFLLGTLVKGPAQVRRFSALRGLERLLDVYDPDNAGGDGRDGFRRRCAFFVADVFLDENMKDESENIGLNTQQSPGAQRVLVDTSTNDHLLEWCGAFRTSSTKLNDARPESSNVKEQIDAALAFSMCQIR